MEKRIFKNVIYIVFLTMFLLLILLLPVINSSLQTQTRESMKSLRVTVISTNGDVIFDNYKPNLTNHSDRPEFIDALNDGTGESERFSSTLEELTYYYAFKLNHDNILRLSFTLSSIYSWIYTVIPMVAICLLIVLMISFLLAKQLTAKIVQPINNANYENISDICYDELSPFIKTINTQKKELNDQLVVLENRADTIKIITENMKEGLILLDKSGTILSANNSINDLYETKGVIGKNILHLIRDSEFAEKINQCLSGLCAETTFTKDSRSYTIYLNPVISKGKISGAVVLFLNTTEKTKSEKQRREFSANVSHELKTPLTTITALSEMISTGIAKPEDVKRFSERITEQSKRLVSLIDDIIKVSELDEMSSSEKSFENFSLTSLANTVLDSLQDEINTKNIAVTLSNESINVFANRRMIDELIYNLIDNSIKYNNPDGKININLSSNSENFAVTISDTGIGIATEHLERIFERFYRVDKSRSRRTGGTGLGLSIVKHIVEHHNGRVDIKSRPSVGTAITCIIPHSLPNP